MDFEANARAGRVLRRVAQAALALVATCTLAAPATTLTFRDAPVDRPHEQRGEARAGYIWLPGYWTWNGDRYVWRRGGYTRSKRQSFRPVPLTRRDADGRYAAMPGVAAPPPRPR